MRKLFVLAALLLFGGGITAQEEAGKKEKADSGLGVSEEEFKALHELTKERRPAPKGEMIGLKRSNAYLSLPTGEPPFPAIVVVHEWWGLNEHIRYWADRLAADGYAALAVDLYGGKTADNNEDAMAYMQAANKKPGHCKAVLKEAHAFLAASKRVQAKKRGCVGWCFGGGWSLQQALQSPDLDACVVYYGALVDDVDALRNIKAPILGIFANKDGWITPKKVDAFAAALEKAGVEHEILRYDAQHAFANPSGKNYDRKSAEDAWGKVRKFFAKKLKTAK